MKKLVLLVIVVLLGMVCISGCKKDNEILLNPSLSPLESDDTIKSVINNFTEKSFKELSRHCWVEPKTQKCMVLFTKTGNGSHASEADIGGFFAEYKAETKNWELKAQSLAFKQSGSWGVAPEPHFIKLGPDRYGFIMEPGYMGQGYTSNLLNVYGVVGNNFVEMLGIPSYSDNSGTGKNDSDFYEVKVDLYQMINNKKDFYDMKAKLIINGKYTMSPDDEFSKIFGKSNEVGFTFKDGIYLVADKN